MNAAPASVGAKLSVSMSNISDTRPSVLGLTFEEVRARLRPRERAVAALRADYAAVLHGRPPDGLLRAEPYPIVRTVGEGDLTKFVQRTADGLEIESVVIPMGGTHRSWQTLCVSSQVGCGRGCTFCETAQLGLLRNLTAAEIVGQVVAARRNLGAVVRNVVFMGMGEPMDNFDHVVHAVRVLSDPAGLSIAKGRITISTVGRCDGIRRLSALGWRRINLAVSLNAPNDEIRTRIMPINRTDNMAALREAMLAFPHRRGAAIMVEYVLIPGVNDALEHADELAAYLRGVRCCVNVIPYNPRRDSPWPAPSEELVAAFLDRLEAAGQFCKRRITKGRDLMAACGQLGNRALSRRAHLSPARSL
jgi:23S rRNA (adenine2503-C2)-methyltransferase